MKNFKDLRTLPSACCAELVCFEVEHILILAVLYDEMTGQPHVLIFGQLILPPPRL